MSMAAMAQMVCPLVPQGMKSKGVASLESFQQIAILENGRIKPLDTFAQNLLLQFSGKRTLDRRPAVEWLARLVFASETTFEEKIFLINNPELPVALGIEPDSKRRYSFLQLEQIGRASCRERVCQYV